MTSLLRRRKKPRTKEYTGPIRCPGHLAWVRKTLECLVAGKDAAYPCKGRIEPHHVKTRGAGGGDEQVVPLCSEHHAQLDRPWWSGPKFEDHYKVNMADAAAEAWNISPHGQKYRAEMRERERNV